MTVKQILVVTLLAVSPLISVAYDYYTATSDLNVRKGAGPDYSVSFTLQKGSEVEILSKNGSWYQIKYLKKIGYANSKYLKFSWSTSESLNESTNKSDDKFDTPPQTSPYLLIGVCVCLTAFIVFVFFRKKQGKLPLEMVKKSERGTISERHLALQLLKYGIPAQRIFHDLYIKKYKGHFSQIDLAVITEVGIIVFEVKDYSGWIYGRGNQLQWTQVLDFGKQKYRFYNPIMQNSSHISELRKQLAQYNYVPIHSVVVFYGDCELKEISFVPDGTYIVKFERIFELLTTILREKKPVHYTNENEIIRVLKEAVFNGAFKKNQIQHNENIKDMLGKHRVFD